MHAVRPGPGRDPEATESLRLALRHLLGPDPAPWCWPGTVSVDRFARQARRHRLLSFLHRERDRLEVPEPLLDHIRDRDEVDRFAALLSARELLRALDVLAAEHIDTLTVKGVVLAQLAYGDLAARGAGDLDLLVRPADVGRAHRALDRAGWPLAVGYPVPGTGWAWSLTRRYAYELSYPGPTSTIDLHWRLDPTGGGLPDFGTLWSRRSTVDIAGRTVPTLSRWDTLTHSASHAAKDDWRTLRSLVDVVRLAADPAVWVDPPARLRPAQWATLRVALHQLGTPPAVPAALRPATAPTRSRAITRAYRSQAELDRPDPGASWPGAGAADVVRRWSRGSHTPADLIRVGVGAALPARALGPVADRSPLTGVLLATVSRLGRFRSRSSTVPAAPGPAARPASSRPAAR